MISTLLLFFALSAPVSSTPGNEVQAPCEWHHDSVSAIDTQVCAGTVVAKRDAAGNVVRYSDWR